MQRTKGHRNRGEMRQASAGSVLREMKEGFGLYVPLWSKMEDNKEHCARRPREPSSREKTEWGFRLYFPQSTERVGEGKWERGEGYWERKRVQSYLNGAGSARGEGNTQGRKLCFLNLWEWRPNALTLPFFCVSGGMWLFKEGSVILKWEKSKSKCVYSNRSRLQLVCHVEGCNEMLRAQDVLLWCAGVGSGVQQFLFTKQSDKHSNFMQK